jgi:hypothetical protein
MRSRALIIVVVGACGSATPAPAPAAAPAQASTAPSINVEPRAMDALRVSGDVAIKPDDKTHEAMLASGKPQVIGAWKVCIDSTGAQSEPKMLLASGFPAYDEELRAGVWAWRFKPYVTSDGRAVAVCTAFTFKVMLPSTR